MQPVITLFLAMTNESMYSRAFHPVTYRATIIATTTVGTTLADFADRSLAIGNAGGSALLFATLA